MKSRTPLLILLLIVTVLAGIASTLLYNTFYYPKRKLPQIETKRSFSDLSVEQLAMDQIVTSDIDARRFYVQIHNLKSGHLREVANLLSDQTDPKRLHLNRLEITIERWSEVDPEATLLWLWNGTASCCGDRISGTSALGPSFETITRQALSKLWNRERLSISKVIGELHNTSSIQQLWEIALEVISLEDSQPVALHYWLSYGGQTRSISCGNIIEGLRAYAKIEPESALSFIQKIPQDIVSNRSIERLQNIVLEEWGADFPEAAEDWIENASLSGLRKEQLPESIVIARARIDPENAAGSIDLLANNQKFTAVTEIASQWALTNASGCLDWLGTIDNPLIRVSGQNAVVRELMEKNPDHGLQLVEQVTGKFANERALLEYAQLRAAQDVGEAIDWFESQPVSEQKITILRGIVEVWGNRDPVGSAEYVFSTGYGDLDKNRLFVSILSGLSSLPSSESEKGLISLKQWTSGLPQDQRAGLNDAIEHAAGVSVQLIERWKKEL